MDKLIIGFILAIAGGIVYNENEKLKYERYRKEVESKTQLERNIRHTINQLINSVSNQTTAVWNLANHKKKILYLNPGDHIAIDRFFPMPYTHHGIYIGNNQAIHYVPPGIIQETGLDEFRYYSDGYIYKVDSETQLSPEQIINIAKSKIGEKNYDYIMNNCETFTRLCRYGDGSERKIK